MKIATITAEQRPQKRFQFSIRTALVMMMLTGLLLTGGMAAYRTYFVTPRVITTEESHGIEKGMTQFAVRWAIGPPAQAKTNSSSDVCWTYDLEDGEGTVERTLEIGFGIDGKVSTVIWTGRGMGPAFGGSVF